MEITKLIDRIIALKEKDQILACRRILNLELPLEYKFKLLFLYMEGNNE